MKVLIAEVDPKVATEEQLAIDDQAKGWRRA